ncbi:non-ribosomal peptide synthetase, partial [Corallococcus sp. CA047B]|uniref:condensation domain-containing protein n=1 Tax=Corallococcus sp. CA047B TaxID=2316729 RepID=UPI000ED708E5
GKLEFLGRVDFQLKVRGYRVELGEVEAGLGACEGVREAVVVAREDVPGDKRLVGYVVAKAGHTLDSTALRSELKGRLPEYMVPSALVVLEALPLNANGKVDRKALPEPEQLEGDARGFTAPRTPTEQQLASIWSELLGAKQVGLGDSFFELGGHSLLATQAISRIRQTFQVELPLRALFEDAVLERLAARIDLAVHAGSGVRMPPLVPVARTNALPLSFAQQRLWFLDQLEPGGTSYNIPTAVRLSGELDVGALRRTFGELVRRHESLRTTFRALSGSPVQVVAPASEVPLTWVDLSGEADGEARAQALAEEEVRRPFDLERGPLFRVTLIRLSDVEHVLLLSVHHIVSDGWSRGVLVREVASLYGAYSTGQPSPLPELAVQYADYAAWQRDWLRGEVLEAQLAYWKRQLGGAPHALELPTDRPRPAVQTFRGSSCSVTMPLSLRDALWALSREEGATPFMTLLAAWQVLLSRYSGQDDISVGTPIAGRNRTELEGLIGFFINTLVLRTHVAGDATFRQVLRQVREVALGAYAHQEVPFEKLVEELKPERDMSRSSLFQVMFSLQNAPLPVAQLPTGLRLQPVDAEGDTAKFELSLDMGDRGQGLSASLEYNTDLFDAATAQRILKHFSVLLEGIAARPDARVLDLPMLGEAERQRVLVEWNDTDVALPAEQGIAERFAAQARLTPDALAVVAPGEEALTYGALETQANQLAHHLRSQGVGPEVLVGVCLERTPRLLVALLGILKAGGAYVPLDPSYPADRLALMVSESRMSLLLTQQSLEGTVEAPGLPRYLLDAEAPARAGLPKDAPVRTAS